MVRYQITPGAVATPPTKYIGQVHAPKGEVLVFLHPQCGCSMATVDELQRMMSKTGKDLTTTVYFFKPKSEPESWCVDTRLWNEAKQIPGAKLLVDVDGKTARAYGAHCSGQILMYSGQTGKLVFSGGITESRGHEGGGRGEDAIMAFARTGSCNISHTNVFGCALW